VRARDAGPGSRPQVACAGRGGERSNGGNGWIKPCGQCSPEPEVEWTLHWPASSLDPDHALCVAALEAHEFAAEATRFVGAPPLQGPRYVEDTSFLSPRGAPALSYRPGNISVAHRPDEFGPTDGLVVTAKTYAVLAMHWCGYPARRLLVMAHATPGLQVGWPTARNAGNSRWRAALVRPDDFVTHGELAGAL